MAAFGGEFVDWLKSWPPTVWSTIGGSTITLMGVMFSDWRNTRRLHIQHTFSARESELARAIATKKEVYLSAAVVLARTQDYLMSLATADNQPAKAPMEELSELVGKVALVGETNTVVLAQEVTGIYLAALTKLTTLASAAKSARETAKMHEGYRDKARAQVERVDAEITKAQESATFSEEEFNALKRSKAGFQATVQHHWRLEIEALQLNFKEVNRFMGAGLDVMKDIGDASVHLLVAIRRELGQSTDEGRLIKAIKDQRDLGYQGLREYLQALEQEFNNVEADRKRGS